MEIKRINLVGFGNVGQALYKQLVGKVEIVDVYTRSRNISLAKKWDISFTNNIKDLSSDVDLNIIAIPDSAIHEIAVTLNKDLPVVHTSGGVSKEVLVAFSSFGIFYPLQTFTKGISVDFSVIPFFIEANTNQFENVLLKFAKDHFSASVYIANSETRKYIHLSAIITSNFLTYFLGIAEDILKEKNVPIDVLKSLLNETLRKSIASGPKMSLTGPAARGDREIIDDYKEMLSDLDFKKIFSLVNEKIFNQDFTVL
ncbi:MAG: Rossmann-like and DUF2520 domain-containing protein [Crocinitomicaceae bacterium]